VKWQTETTHTHTHTPTHRGSKGKVLGLAIIILIAWVRWDVLLDVWWWPGYSRAHWHINHQNMNVLAIIFNCVLFFLKSEFETTNLILTNICSHVLKCIQNGSTEITQIAWEIKDFETRCMYLTCACVCVCLWCCVCQNSGDTISWRRWKNIHSTLIVSLSFYRSLFLSKGSHGGYRYEWQIRDRFDRQTTAHETSVSTISDEIRSGFWDFTWCNSNLKNGLNIHRQRIPYLWTTSQAIVKRPTFNHHQYDKSHYKNGWMEEG